MYHFMAIAASGLLLVATSAVANEMPSRQFSEKSTIEKSSPPSSDLAPVRIAQRAKDGAAASKKSATATPPATADVKTADGKDVGTVTLTQTRSGVRLSGSLKGLPAGEHALHMHSVGKCEPPFTSAGPHFNPAQKKHGKLNPEGHHAGDDAQDAHQEPRPQRAVLVSHLRAGNHCEDAVRDGVGAPGKDQRCQRDAGPRECEHTEQHGDGRPAAAGARATLYQKEYQREARRTSLV